MVGNEHCWWCDEVLPSWDNMQPGLWREVRMMHITQAELANSQHMRAVTRGDRCSHTGEDAGWSGVSAWGSRMMMIGWWWFTPFIWINPLVMTDKNIKMSCDQCPLPGAGSGEIGIRVPSSRLLPAFKLSERDRKPGDNIWGQGILTTLQGLHSAHIHDARGMCLWHGDPIRKDSLFPLWSLQKQISFYFPLFPFLLFLWGTKWITF